VFTDERIERTEMALVESGLRDLGWRRSMQSLREQYRPPDDRVEVAPGLKGSEFDRWEYASALRDVEGPSLREIRSERERRKHPQLSKALDSSEPERVTRELAEVRTRSDPDSSVYTPRKHKAPVNTPSRKHRFRDVAHQLTGKRRRTP
jgi:hypothetical protein